MEGLKFQAAISQWLFSMLLKSSYLIADRLPPAAGDDVRLPRLMLSDIRPTADTFSMSYIGMPSDFHIVLKEQVENLH